jgi:hypothetical protein
MKSTMRYAALTAALITALGLVALPRVGAAGANDDLVFLQPPGVNESGDPDIPDGTISITVFGFTLWGKAESGRIVVVLYRARERAQTAATWHGAVGRGTMDTKPR